jgi:endonuclease YncB( thermonuclease family)
MPNTKAIILVWLISLAPAGLLAYDWSGRVVAVHDGDTLTILHLGRKVNVRLNEIDAPELDQPYGQQAKRSLSSLCYGRYADVQPAARDKYDRQLAHVKCSGIDANAEQLRRGMAWFYTEYSQSESLKALEAGARTQRLGLWTDTRPEPPWAFRHQPDEANARHQPVPNRVNRRSALHCGSRPTCGALSSCDEARYYLRHCGFKWLDGNHDGIPCASLCRPDRK